MKIIRHSSARGFAVIVAMIAITILSILVAAFALSMKVETKLAQNVEEDPQLLRLGRSGVEYARWILAQQATGPGGRYDSLNQKWAGGPGSLTDSNSPLSNISLDNYPLGDGKFSIKIVDLERKININSAGQAMIRQVLTLMGVDADTISVVSDSINDWIDADNAPGLAGAENDYYQSLDPPYYAKNAPIDDLSELLLVKGVTLDMYWGSRSVNHNPAAFQHPKLGFGHAPGEAPDYPFGLVDIFTPFSDGRININTADATVLQMIPGADANIAQEIIKQRSGPDGVDGTEDDTPFTDPGQIAALVPQAGGQLGRICDVRSSTFEETVTAQAGNSKRDFKAILFRAGLEVQVVGFYWK